MAIQGQKYLPLIFAASEKTGLPAAFIYAVMRGESSFNPTLKMPGTKKDPEAGARGLLQVVDSVREGYNRAHDTDYTRDDMYDPAINVEVATWQLAKILQSYRRFVPALATDWRSPKSVALLVQGWNSGPNGLIRLAGNMRSKGIALDVDSVKRFAQKVVKAGEPLGYGSLSRLPARAYRHLANRETRWARGVAANYMRWKTKPPFHQGA